MTLKLGLNGSQIDIEQDSLIIDSIVRQSFNKSSRSIDSTLHIDFVPTKKDFNFDYDVLSDANVTIYEGLYDDQVNNSSPLKLTIGTDNYNVYLQPISTGALLRDKDHVYAVSLFMEEV